MVIPFNQATIMPGLRNLQMIPFKQVLANKHVFLVALAGISPLGVGG
jgi:hypothetical protein